MAVRLGLMTMSNGFAALIAEPLEDDGCLFGVDMGAILPAVVLEVLDVWRCCSAPSGRGILGWRVSQG